MSILRADTPPVKPRSVLPPPQFCERCRGSGWLGYDGSGSSVECPACHGWGYRSDPEPAVPTIFLAADGLDVVDCGLDLASFVRQLLADWPSVDGDLILWRQEQRPGEPLRSKAVAVIHPGPDGRSRCRYL